MAIAIDVYRHVRDEKSNDEILSTIHTKTLNFISQKLGKFSIDQNSV